jgi:hypothetical protein
MGFGLSGTGVDLSGAGVVDLSGAETAPLQRFYAKFTK